jgi:hypothetical protein
LFVQGLRTNYDVAADGRFVRVYHPAVVELVVVQNFSEELNRLVPN